MFFSTPVYSLSWNSYIPQIFLTCASEFVVKIFHKIFVVMIFHKIFHKIFVVKIFHKDSSKPSLGRIQLV